ncbi:MAG: 4-hydroxy-tetrahydrodipicolinate synthase [Deltaproteobacteria bacterium]|nr:MAG: 4-hydroxy-tetrahydrodipicolinate synthase [Deltaproteobacteria bacterium]
MSFTGALTAIVTPFSNGRIDEDALRRLVETQIQAGIDGLVPCGTTGESPTLSHAEHAEVVAKVVEATKGRVPVLAGAGSNCTREAIDLARACREAGASGTLQITPYYNKPTQEGLVAHFTAIADAVDLPMVLYNVPGRTGVDLRPETVARLARHPNIVGIKEATGDMTRVPELRRSCGPDFSILSGDDATVLPLLACGGDGVISVTANVVPGRMARLCAAARRGDLETARRLHDEHLPLTRALFAVTNPVPVKAVLAMLGRIEDELRLPLVPLDEDHPVRSRLRELVVELGLATATTPA